VAGRETQAEPEFSREIPVKIRQENGRDPQQQKIQALQENLGR